MNWMFESRSDNYYDEDPETGTYSQSTQWYEYLLIPFLIVPLLLLSAIYPIFLLLFIFLHDFYETVKRISKSGELEFPKLVLAGVFLTIILVSLISNHLFDISEHPIITFCSAVFILLCTIAPLTGLVLRFFKQT